MLIDWLTIRLKLDLSELGVALHNRILDYLGLTVCMGADGAVKWQKHSLDIDALRSDSPGLYWTITADGQSNRYLTIGASPSSIENDGLNVFGSLDIQECATVLIQHAARSFDAILPDLYHWQCRRLDVTANYDMGSPAQVKQALRLLLASDAPRRKTNSDSKGGDTVYWNPTSDLQTGKAYHKGPQLRMKVRRGDLLIDDDTLDLADNLLRLELKLGSRWFRRYEARYEWHSLTPYELTEIHHKFFDSLIGGRDVEVHDMGTLLRKLEQVCPTPGRALAAHRTWALMKVLGYTQAKESMPDSTFRRHCSYLRDAGLSDADLCAASEKKVIQFPTQSLVLRDPVLSWTEIRRVS
ncbi:phage replication protein CRI [mine drainage metagenome]|uniref:Phage replication protein CRI n=1 Tax=mine drainage metagenome TaxID=410659 RepID=A0A1J5SQZ0_9ZZZZ